MVEFEQTQGIYLGRELKGDGDKKDGSKWKKWTFNFKPNEESEKSFGLSYFQSGVVEDEGVKWEEMPVMEEGKWYTMSFTVKPYTNSYGDQKAKNVFKIEPGKVAKAKPTQEEVKAFDAQAWVKFVDEYDAGMSDKKEQMSNFHMLGAYIVNKHGAPFAKEIELAKAHFANK